MERWHPPVELSKQEEFICKRLVRVKKLFGFLRRHRHKLFDEAFQVELEGMYRATGAGKAPRPPALMAMAVLLQAYTQASDAEAVELTVMDLRWQMVLGCLGSADPAFSQGALQAFRERLIACELDQRLLERTVELAKSTGEFDFKKLPSTVRVAMDSSPFEGAGKVEDTLNLLGHAARRIVELAAKQRACDVSELAMEAGIPMVLAPSVKAWLDEDWSAPDARANALNEVDEQVRQLLAWLNRSPSLEISAPLAGYIAALKQVQKQDVATRQDGMVELIQGVAADRRISVEDSQMRHGRKSKSKTFNGYRRHIGHDLDTQLILACTVTPGNQPEAAAAERLNADITRQGLTISELSIDRGYISSPLVGALLKEGGLIVSKPWAGRNSTGLMGKSEFHLDMRARSVTCPAGERETFKLGTVVHFPVEKCRDCPLKKQCTTSDHRSLSIAADEPLQHRLRSQLKTPRGRAKARERLAVEHRLAHVSQRQGKRARYRGVRRNVFDLRRTAAVMNLEVIHARVTGTST